MTKRIDPYEKFHNALKRSKVDKIELWSLDYTFACWMLPRLKAFLGTKQGHPCSYKNEQAWENELAKLVEGFEWLVSDNRWMPSEYKKVNEIYALFAKMLPNLWN